MYLFSLAVVASATYLPEPGSPTTSQARTKDVAVLLANWQVPVQYVSKLDRVVCMHVKKRLSGSTRSFLSIGGAAAVIIVKKRGIVRSLGGLGSGRPPKKKGIVVCNLSLYQMQQKQS